VNSVDERHPDEQISAFVDGELGPDEYTQVKRHLEECERCRAYLDDLRTLSSTADAPPPVPERLLANIESRLPTSYGTAPARRVPRSRRRWRMTIPLAAAGSLAAMVAVAALLLQQRGALPWQPAPAVKDVAREATTSAKVEAAPDAATAPHELGEQAAPTQAAPPQPEKKAELDTLGYAEARQREEMSSPYALAPSPAPAEGSPAGAADTRGNEAAAEPGTSEPAPPAAPGLAKAQSRPAELPRPQVGATAPPTDEEQRMARGGVAQSAAPVSFAAAPCRTTWYADAPALRLDGAGTAQVNSIAADLGGSVQPAEGNHNRVLLVVPRGRWPELIERLRRGGANGAADLPAPPQSYECAGLLLAMPSAAAAPGR